MKQSILRASACFALLLAVGLSGCAAPKVSQLRHGPGVELKSVEVASYSGNQDAVLRELYQLAGFGEAPKESWEGPKSAQWDLVIRAGMQFADRTCDDYMQALFRLNRDKQATVSQIGLLGAATAGILGAVDVAAKSIALTAIAFGLAGSSVENLSSNLLFELDPSSVKALVNAQRVAYREKLGKGYLNRADAFTALRGYVVLCVPPNIESQVNLAVAQKAPHAQAAIPALGIPPIVTNNESVVRESTFRRDSAGDALQIFASPGGVPDPRNLQRLQDYLNAKNIAASAQYFLRAAEFANEREEAAKFFKLQQ